MSFLPIWVQQAPGGWHTLVLLTVTLVSIILYLFDTTFTKKLLLKIFLDVEKHGNISYRIGPYLKNFLIILLPYATRLTCRSAAHHQPLSFLTLAQVDLLIAEPSVELIMDPTTAGYGSLYSIWTPFKWVGCYIFFLKTVKEIYYNHLG